MSIAENVARIKAEMAAAAIACGRDPREIQLCAATKMNDADAVRQAIAAGVDCCGENRVQELTAKLAENAYEGAPVHFIGHLQTNKVKYIIDKVCMIHSLDSLRLAAEIDKQAAKRGIVMDVLVEINSGEEEAKGNAQAQATYALMKAEGEQGKFNFVGNVESSYLFTGKVADVVVCDGFVGNTVLKLVEGFYQINARMGVSNPFWAAMNYENVGGTPVLGINAPVTIGHGKSTPLAIKNMVLATERTISANVTAKLQEAFKA